MSDTVKTFSPKELADALSAPSVRDYWEALGRFVSTFSLVEDNMQLALWACAGLRAPIGPAVFSGVRVDAAMGLIKRVAEAKNWPKEECAKLADIFAQIGEINRVRNDLLHYGAKASGPDEWLVSNSLAAHTTTRIRQTKITLPALGNMTADLYKIACHLASIALRESSTPHVIPPGVQGLLDSAWLYKPERQHHRSKTNPKPPRKQSRPPRSSQG